MPDRPNEIIAPGPETGLGTCLVPCALNCLGTPGRTESAGRFICEQQGVIMNRALWLVVVLLVATGIGRAYDRTVVLEESYSES